MVALLGRPPDSGHGALGYGCQLAACLALGTKQGTAWARGAPGGCAAVSARGAWDLRYGKGGRMTCSWRAYVCARDVRLPQNACMRTA